MTKFTSASNLDFFGSVPMSALPPKVVWNMKISGPDKLMKFYTLFTPDSYFSSPINIGSYIQTLFKQNKWVAGNYRINIFC